MYTHKSSSFQMSQTSSRLRIVVFVEPAQDTAERLASSKHPEKIWQQVARQLISKLLTLFLLIYSMSCHGLPMQELGQGRTEAYRSVKFPKVHCGSWD